MEQLSSGLTWTEMLERFAADGEFSLSLDRRKRRTTKYKRRNDVAEERGVWRLILQRSVNGRLETVLRKNLRDVAEDDSLLTQKVSEAQVELLNSLID